MRRHLLWGLTVATVTISSSAAILLTTERGMRWSLDTISQLSGERLVIEQAHGRWLGPIELHGVRWQTKTLTLEIRRLALHWQPAALWQRLLQLDLLTVEGLHIDSRAKKKDIEAILGPRLPFAIALNKARLTDLQIRLRDARLPGSLNAELAGAHYRDQLLKLDSLSLKHPQLTAQLAGTVSFTMLHASAATLDWQLRPSVLSRPVRGTSRFSGEPAVLQHHHRFSGALSGEAHGKINLHQRNLPWQLTTELSPVALQRLHPKLPNALAQLHFQGQGDTRQWRGTLRADLDSPLIGRWRVVTRARVANQQWRLQQLQLLAADHPARLAGSGFWSQRDRSWRFQGRASGIDPHALRPAWPSLTLATTFNAQGQGLDGSVQAQASLNQARIGRWQGRIELSRRGTLWQLANARLQAVNHPGQLTLHGGWDQARREPLQLHARWQQLLWPELGHGSQRGELDLIGRPEQYRLRGKVDLLAANLPSRWTLAAHGNRQTLTVDALTTELLGGQLHSRGSLGWANGTPRWQLSIDGRDLDLGQRWPTWPAHLAFQADTHGELVAGTPQLTLQLRQASGTLRQQSIEAHGTLVAHGLNHTSGKLAARLGQAALEADATLQDGRLHSTALVSLPDLAQLHPQASGRLQAQLALSGLLSQPWVNADITGNQLRFGAQHIEHAHATLSAPLDNLPASTLALQAQRIQLGATAIQTARLDVSGSPHQHHAQLALHADEIGQLALELNGQWQDQRWRAELQQASFDSARQQHWRAGRSLLIASADQLSLQPWCWRSDQASSCVSAQPLGRQDWQAKLELQHLDLTGLRPWLKEPRIRPAGWLDGKAQFGFKAMQLLNAEADVAITDGEFSIPLGKERWRNTHVARLNAKLFALPGLAQLNADIRLPGDDQLTLTASLPDWEPTHGLLNRHQPLQGRINLSAQQLGILQEWLPDLAQPQGHLHGDIQLSGQLGNPLLAGDLHLDDGQARIPRLGLTLRDLRARLHGQPGEALQLTASTRSGDGTLQLVGQLTPHALNDWGLKFQFKGKQVEVSRLPQAHVIASPELSFSSRRGVRELNGNILIPEAYLVLPERTTTLPLSPDVVIVGSEPGQADERLSRLHYLVSIELGDAVNLRGYGFRGRLNGVVAVEDNNGGDTAYGELNIEDGEYRAYGQKLRVEKGQLLFPGGPLDNPGISARAVRSDLDRTIIAGVRVGGFLRKPELKLFSTPAMDEADILAYLLLGRPLKLASSAEGDTLYRAATGLGLAGGELLAGRIAQRFAFDEFTLQSRVAQAGSTSSSATRPEPISTVPAPKTAAPSYVEQTSVVLGKYLSPRLYVRYAYGIGQTPSVLFLRYQLSKRFTLETASGNQSGADLRFTVER